MKCWLWVSISNVLSLQFILDQLYSMNGWGALSTTVECSFFFHILRKDCKSLCLYFAAHISGLQVHICGVSTSLPRNMVHRHALGDHRYRPLSANVPPINGGGGLVAKLCPTLVTPWTVTRQASPSMGFSRQEYWSGLPLPSPRDLPDPGIEPGSPALQVDSLLTDPWRKPYQCPTIIYPMKVSSAITR